MTGTPGVEADVFVTNPLPHTVHILTCDYLMHRAPVLLEMRAERLTFRAPAVLSSGFEMHPFQMSGGAFVVSIAVGGSYYRCTVDTGATSTLCLNRSAPGASSLRERSVGHVRQVGVNGERICSDVILVPIRIGSIEVGEAVPVLLNDANASGVDGYVGMGVLRCFDIWMSSKGLGLRASGLSPPSTLSMARGTPCPRR